MDSDRFSEKFCAQKETIDRNAPESPMLSFESDYVLYVWTLHLDELCIFVLIACAELILMIDQREFEGV